MSAQIFWAVYDTSVDSDFFGFDTLAEAEAEVVGWLNDRLDYELTHSDGAEWGRIYVCSANADTVPDIGDTSDWADSWSLWDYEDDAICYRKIHESWGSHGMSDIG